MIFSDLPLVRGTFENAAAPAHFKTQTTITVPNWSRRVGLRCCCTAFYALL